MKLMGVDCKRKRGIKMTALGWPSIKMGKFLTEEDCCGNRVQNLILDMWNKQTHVCAVNTKGSLCVYVSVSIIHMSLEFRKEVWARDTILRIVSKKIELILTVELGEVPRE